MGSELYLDKHVDYIKSLDKVGLARLLVGSAFQSGGSECSYGYNKMGRGSRLEELVVGLNQILGFRVGFKQRVGVFDGLFCDGMRIFCRNRISTQW